MRCFIVNEARKQQESSGGTLSTLQTGSTSLSLSFQVHLKLWNFGVRRAQELQMMLVEPVELVKFLGKLVTCDRIRFWCARIVNIVA